MTVISLLLDVKVVRQRASRVAFNDLKEMSGKGGWMTVSSVYVCLKERRWKFQVLFSFVEKSLKKRSPMCNVQWNVLANINGRPFVRCRWPFVEMLYTLLFSLSNPAKTNRHLRYFSSRSNLLQIEPPLPPPLLLLLLPYTNSKFNK